MNKKIIILLFGVVLVLIIILVSLSFPRSQSSKSTTPSSSIVKASATPIPTFLPDTQPTGAAQDEKKFQLQNSPDVFLSNQTPYSTKSFSVTSDFKTQPTGHFYFIVTLKSKDSAQDKISFLNWLKSLGLSDNQINALDVTYN